MERTLVHLERLERPKISIQNGEKQLNQNTKSRRPAPSANKETAWVLLWIGRFLLILSAVSLITMPLTQHLWTWDHFLHGGHDFELAALMVLTVLCLVLVNSQHCKRYFDSLLTQCFWLACNAKKPESQGIPVRRAFSIFQMDPVNCQASGPYSSPLQI